MSSRIEYVHVIVVDPDGTEYDVEINPTISDSDLLNELVLNPDLGLNPTVSSYKLRSVHRTGDKKIRENCVIVMDYAKQSNVKSISRRE